MHVVLITPTTPHRGGIAHFGTVLAQQLDARHTLITWGFRRLYPRWLFPGSTDADPSQHTIACTVHRQIDGLNPLTWWQAWRTLPPVDLIIWQWWTPFWLPLIWFVTWQARRRGIATLAICHQLVEPDAAAWQARLAVWALKRADAVLFLGQAPQVWPNPHRTVNLPGLTSLMPNRPTKEAARQHLNIDSAIPLVLSFGFVRDYKGIDTIIHAMANSHTAYHLIIAGEWWPLKNDIRQLITRYHLEQRVHIYDAYIPNEQVATFFAAADIVVLPYRSGSVSGVAGLAQQWGVPMITSDVGTLAGAVIPFATLTADDIPAWREALDRFFVRPMSAPPIPDDGWRTCIDAIDALTSEVQR